MDDTAAPSATKSDEATNRAVYSRILGALHSGRLRPGQRLPEPAIARALGVSRERVRRALHRLAHEGWLELVPNKGACLPELEPHTLEKVFEARRLLEGAVVRLLAERPTAAMLAELDAHLDAEAEAADSKDRSRQIPLSGGFHELLFAQTGNPWLLGFLRQVVTPTVMAYAIFAPEPLPECGGPHEHRAIVDAIRNRDPATAERRMHAHLDEAMAHVRRLRQSGRELSVETILAASGPAAA
jgi:DNA-binding GntR family transcriptional regulator